MKWLPNYLPDFFSIGLLTSSYPAPVQKDHLVSFDQRLKNLKTAHAKVLAAWAGLNLLSGSLLIFTTTDSFFYLHFHAMNASWGFVNAGVAAFLYLHHNSIFNHPLSLLQQMDLQRHAEKMMLLNIGLDIAFIAGGVALHFHANNPALSYPLLWTGFGSSIMMQGTFLLILDLIFYQKHVKNRKKVYPSWKSMLENL